MLKKYRKTGTILPVQQLMEIKGGIGSDDDFFLPSCANGIPCPIVCSDPSQPAQAYECRGTTCFHVFCPIDPL